MLGYKIMGAGSRVRRTFVTLRRGFKASVEESRWVESKTNDISLFRYLLDHMEAAGPTKRIPKQKYVRKFKLDSPKP